MSIEQIHEILTAIRMNGSEYAADYEQAHSIEDHLYQQFIEWVSVTGTEQQRERALLVLTSQDIDFPRWCA